MVLAVVFSIRIALANQAGNLGGATPVPAAAGTLVPAAVATEAPTPAAGARIALPKGVSRPDASSAEITLIATNLPPPISQREAMQAVADYGVPWGLGGQYQGKTVTVTAWFGLATLGRPGAAGKPWVGRRNIPLKNSDVLDHIENWPMWIIDYGNTVAYGGGTPAQPAPVYNHTVYLVDAQTRTVVEVRFYQGV